MSAVLGAALDFAGRGLHVLPIRAGQKLPATRHGLKDASTDPVVIRQWWACWPRANVGRQRVESYVAAVAVDA